MDEIYGSEGTQATNSAFVWASSIDFSFISQKVGTTGVIHLGVLPHSALQTEDGIPAAFTIDDLIRMSTTTIDVSQNRFGFGLHSAMAVDSLVRDNPLGGKDTVINAM